MGNETTKKMFEDMAPGLRHAVWIVIGWGEAMLHKASTEILSDSERHDVLVRALELIQTADGLNNEMLYPDEDQLARRIRNAEAKLREIRKQQQQLGAKV
jgi:hypothetical protein